MTAAAAPAARKAPLRGATVVGGADDADVAAQLERLAADASAGRVPAPGAPDPALAGAAVRVAIDYADAAELATKAGKAVQALRGGNPAMWKILRAQGVFVGRGAPGKVAFLYTGQGSQYVNMLAELRQLEPLIAATFDEADKVMAPLLGKPLTEYIFADTADQATAERLAKQLMQTEITQPAVLATDLALTRMLGAYGVRPDMVMGHSLGEYGALVAAGALSFDASLEAVSARGREMASLSVDDNGAMAAVFAPLAEIERIVAETDGYVVVANINSTGQAVIGGATDAVERAVAAFQAAGMNASRIPVSHAFHTEIVAPVSEPLKASLRRLDVRPPSLPIVSNVTGDFYPADADADTMLDLLGRQVASPVRFIDGLRTLYAAGARVFVEVGPKKALHGFVEDVLGDSEEGVLALFTNHPKQGDVASFNQALCGLYAAGLGYAEQAPAKLAAPAAQTDDRYDGCRRPGGDDDGRAVRRVGPPPRRRRATRRPPATSRHRLGTARRRAGGGDRRRARPARRRAGLRRREHRPHPGRPAVHRHDSAQAAPRNARPPHHPAGQARIRGPDVRDHRQRVRGHQAGRPQRAAGRGRASSASTPPATPRWTPAPGSPSGPVSTRCATPGFRW